MEVAVLSRLLKRFRRSASTEREMCLGFMYRVDNETLGLSACGSPREIKDAWN